MALIAIQGLQRMIQRPILHKRRRIETLKYNQEVLVIELTILALFNVRSDFKRNKFTRHKHMLSVNIVLRVCVTNYKLEYTPTKLDKKVSIF